MLATDEPVTAGHCRCWQMENVNGFDYVRYLYLAPSPCWHCDHGHGRGHSHGHHDSATCYETQTSIDCATLSAND